VKAMVAARIILINLYVLFRDIVVIVIVIVIAITIAIDIAIVTTSAKAVIQVQA